MNITYEIIVVDNGSTDGSRIMLEKEYPQVVKIYNEDNKGFAVANNQAIKISHGNYILLLNSDTIVLNGAIQKTFVFMVENSQYGIVGCKLLNTDKSIQPSCRSFPSVFNILVESIFLYRIFPKSRLFGKYYMSFFEYDKIHEVDVVMGAYMMIRRDVFEKVGLLDESYFMYTEEADFCYRAKNQGFKIVFIPHAQVIHHSLGSVKDLGNYYHTMHFSQILFIKKHFTGLRKNLAIFLKYFGIFIRIPIYFVYGLLTNESKILEKSRSYLRILVNNIR